MGLERPEKQSTASTDGQRGSPGGLERLDHQSASPTYNSNPSLRGRWIPSAALAFFCFPKGRLRAACFFVSEGGLGGQKTATDRQMTDK
eukprot:9504174-Pyramimonas_sp.AAC.3